MLAGRQRMPCCSSLRDATKLACACSAGKGTMAEMDLLPHAISGMPSFRRACCYSAGKRIFTGTPVLIFQNGLMAVAILKLLLAMTIGSAFGQKFVVLT